VPRCGKWTQWAAEAFPDPENLRQSLRRIEASPFVTKHESLRGFVFNVATGKLNEIRVTAHTDR
jgi:carbonic anhydrase